MQLLALVLPSHHRDSIAGFTNAKSIKHNRNIVMKFLSLTAVLLFISTLGFSQGISDYPTDHDRKNEQAFPAKPGDLIVHDAMTIHRADANRSTTRTRRALGFIYYSERAREDSEAHEHYQRKLAEDLKSQGKI